MTQIIVAPGLFWYPRPCQSLQSTLVVIMKRTKDELFFGWFYLDVRTESFRQLSGQKHGGILTKNRSNSGGSRNKIKGDSILGTKFEPWV